MASGTDLNSFKEEMGKEAIGSGEEKRKNNISRERKVNSDAEGKTRFGTSSRNFWEQRKNESDNFYEEVVKAPDHM